MGIMTQKVNHLCVHSFIWKRQCNEFKAYCVREQKFLPLLFNGALDALCVQGIER
jgi:hypothetical protein